MILTCNAARLIPYTSNLVNQSKRAAFHFASSEYAACFQDLPTQDTVITRSDALHYIASFDRQEWFRSPIVSLLQGEELNEGQVTDTKDGIGTVNGSQKLATEGEMQRLRDFISSYFSPYTDLRDPIRKIERKLLTDYAGFLIGNQCIGAFENGLV